MIFSSICSAYLDLRTQNSCDAHHGSNPGMQQGVETSGDARRSLEPLFIVTFVQ